LNARLGSFVANKVDAELLEDLLAEVPVGNQDLVSAAESANAADAIYAGITKVRVSGLLEPSGVVVHPEDWAALRVAKVGASSDEYLAGSPFNGGPGQSLFGIPVVTSHRMTQGSALVGAFNTAAQVFSRGGLTVESTNSHGDDFIYNRTRIRAERRLALAVQRPAGFATADLSNGVS
jgi:HK97 family phage major capsid protein